MNEHEITEIDGDWEWLIGDDEKHNHNQTEISATGDWEWLLGDEEKTNHNQSDLTAENAPE
ncbi:hypothetical protein [Fodinicola feengrottensis]|uniref:Uncharacterized protein n=1 Tax=Fodinicola feengrottensis TaxID=435914 RepID=A0ABN2GKL7_9ACTN|nr:hypothetical protein [Fodinicola feengrottensis]